jgi:GNAT superfamily N-acetyltransferase
MSAASTTQVVAMTGKHLPAVATLCADLGYVRQAAGVPARFRELAHDNAHGLLVALDDKDNVIGFLHVFARCMLHDQAAAQVLAMIVGRAHRRRGVGGLLLARAEAWAAERGLVSVMLYSADGRDDAHAFYAACGYRAATGLARYDKSLVSAAKRRKA